MADILGIYWRKLFDAPLSLRCSKQAGSLRSQASIPQASIPRAYSYEPIRVLQLKVRFRCIGLADLNSVQNVECDAVADA